jgi:hypothetical protein
MKRLIAVLVLSVLAGCSGSPADPKDGSASLNGSSLEQENARLKMELAEARGKSEHAGPEATPPARTTLDGVEYEFVAIRRNGNQATMRLAITAKRADAILLNQLRIRLIATDGNEYFSPVGSSGGIDHAAAKLFEGIRKEIEFDLGKLPSDMNEFSTIILPGVGGKGFAKAKNNPVILKGWFKVTS